MKLQNIIKSHGSRIALLAAALALFLFIPACLTASVGLRACLIVLIVSLLGAGGTALFFHNKWAGERVHYFLYDPKKKSSISPEELSAEVIHARVADYLGAFSRSSLSLWEDIPAQLQEKLKAESHFAPLIAYDMLLSLSQCPEKHIGQLFAKTNPKSVTYLCRTISEVGDTELADYIYDLKKEAGNASLRVVTFFQRNAAHFSARALHYTRKNFNSFYVDKK